VPHFSIVLLLSALLRTLIVRIVFFLIDQFDRAVELLCARRLVSVLSELSKRYSDVTAKLLVACVLVESPPKLNWIVAHVAQPTRSLLFAEQSTVQQSILNLHTLQLALTRICAHSSFAAVHFLANPLPARRSVHAELPAFAS
jgi:hypothetical protein